MSISLAALRSIRVAAVTPALGVADVEYNTNTILQCYQEALSQKAQIVLFPELSITAYTCADLFYQQALHSATEKALARLKDATANESALLIVGFPLRHKGQLYNCAAVLQQGRILGIVPKTYLPNYNEFYEMRWFASALDTADESVFTLGNEVPFGSNLLFSQQTDDEPAATSFTLGIEICEDLWAVKSPSTDMVLEGAHIICNLSASNELLGKADYRRDLVRMQSARCMNAYVYASAGAGESTTDVVFAGHNIIAENGTVLAESQRFAFESTMVVADIDIERLENERLRNTTYRTEKPEKLYRHINVQLQDRSVDDIRRPLQAMPFVPSALADRSARCREIFSIQTTALAKRLLHIASRNVVIGLSGGLDSTLALIVCAQTFARLGYDVKGIHAITMPGFGTTQRTKSNADLLAQALGVSYRDIPITEAVRQHFRDLGHDEKVHDILFENAQARERTQILMDAAHQVQGIVIGTGDLSELALGWCTYNGDHMSMYAVNTGIPKTLVRYMVAWCADDLYDGEVQSILRDIYDTPVSPELLPPNAQGEIAQETEKTIGPYELHDFFLYHMLRLQFAPQKILTLASFAFGDKYDKETIQHWLGIFYRRFFSQQFKRSCLPDGPKVGSVALSPRGDWRMPSDAAVRLWLEQLSAE